MFFTNYTGNGIGDNEVVELAEGLRGNCTLKLLNLKGEFYRLVGIYNGLDVVDK